jgi:hypothetical protein
MAWEDDKPKKIAGLAIGGGVVVGLVSLICALISLLAANLMAMGICLLAAALAFGLTANGILRA